MNHIAAKRIMKDIEVLKKNQEALATNDGIYFHIDEANITTLKLLIIPKPKQDASDPSFISPYTGGFFIFEFKFPEDFPLSPPKITFHPQQNGFRLHPNYYQQGKVCLSVINTWGGQDWSPSTSIMSLFHVLEERFSERALCFEPGQENARPSVIKTFNDITQYGTFIASIIPALEGKLPIFADFKDIITKHFKDNFESYIKTIDHALIKYPPQNPPLLRSHVYNHQVTPDYTKVKSKLQKLFAII